MRRIATAAMTELVGTFVLLLAVVTAESSGTRWAPLVTAVVLALLVWLGSGRLGGHFNPAVTLAQAIRGRSGRGRLALLDLPVRWLAQAAGGVLGALLGHAIARHHPMSQALHGHALLRAGAGELVVTFTLVWVVLDVLGHRTPRAARPSPDGGSIPTDDTTPNDDTTLNDDAVPNGDATSNDDAARAAVMVLGLVATVLLLTVGRVSGVALNPAVVLGRGIARLAVWQGLWPWVLLELLAGLFAGLGVRLLDRRRTRTRGAAPEGGATVRH